MNKELQAIQDAWDKRAAAGTKSSSKDGAEKAKEDESVYELSHKYVDAHPEEFAGFDALPLEALVKTIDTYRETDRPEDALRIQVWLWHFWEPQNIGGTYQASVRVRNGN